jgi:crotonobetainyl-CoA:carnitine CoA-transferase CaiB-like acyl-CoA transferase
MEGVRIVELAQYTFVPASGAVLADWGADVIKIEHAVTGDPQRGLRHIADFKVEGEPNPNFSHANRGKRSVGLDLGNPDAHEVLLDLARQADVFLTNFLPSARKKFKIDVDDIRAVNPDIIYVRGSGYGQRGDEADKGGYDSTAFWARGGSAAGSTPPGAETVTWQPSGAYGDSLGGMTIAGGIAAALYSRKMTGEPSVVDVSLVGVGAWATGFSVNLAMLAGGPVPPEEQPKHGSTGNPLIGTYQTADGRWLMFSMLQPGTYWPEFCAVAGREDLAADERFNTVEKIMANAGEAAELVAGIIRARPLAEWTERFQGMKGQWSVVQEPWEVSRDPALRANGNIVPVTDADGVDRELVASPVQFDERPPHLTRAPQFAEHTDEILAELGFDDDKVREFRTGGAVA